ncbi:MAG: hypothetical protein E6G49_11840 [Actinobacteria bacterium]|nr:MAG: hypothetical protein E6G49_11840 [Actinomycetota bacterium]
MDQGDLSVVDGRVELARVVRNDRPVLVVLLDVVLDQVGLAQEGVDVVRTRECGVAVAKR